MRMLVRAMLLVLLSSSMAAVGSPAAAQGWVDPLPGGRHSDVVRVGTDVTVRVDGRVAEVVVEEWFENRGRGLGEGDYLYPLAGEAVFSNFSLYQGDAELRGETMDARRAREIYEEIVRRNRDPALVELVGHGLIRARVFPFQPGERRRITLRYTQLLERSGDAVQLRYGAARRSPGTPVRRPLPIPHGPPHGETAPITFSLEADASVYGEPFSPTHRLDVERSERRLRVRPATALTGDLSIFLPISTTDVGLSVAAHRTGHEDGYFMLTLSAGQTRAASEPRDVTVVVDVSGSMAGVKMEQTRAALRQLLGSLGPSDRFRLVAFNNRIRSSGDGWSAATPAELRSARDWIDRLDADGGTDIAGALQEALRLTSPDDRLPIVVFLTDGLPTVGEQDPERIAGAAAAAAGAARVFAFGLGYDVNTYLLDRLGEAGRGSTAYVQPGEDVERALSNLAARITHPVLVDLEIAGSPVELTEIYPGELPDLFAGQELVVFGRYGGEGEGELRVGGRRGGRAETFTTRAGFPGASTANDYIPRLWASRKIGELTRQARLNGADPELVESIRRTALRYGLLSEYTSHLVQEPEVMARAFQQVGFAAVMASEHARARRQVASAPDLAAAEANAADAVIAGAGEAGARIVSGRTFRLEDGVWMEEGRGPGELDDVAIVVYSTAYFDLLAALPELRRIAAVLEPVVVAGEDVRVRIGAEGASELSEREIQRLVLRFRGR